MSAELAVLTQLQKTVNIPPKVIKNYQSTSPCAARYALISNMYSINSGALTAGVLKSILNISGSGEVTFLSVRVNDATSRTMQLKVTLDGFVVFDSTSTANAIVNYGIIAIGDVINTTTVGALHEIVNFKQSLLVEIASSLTETDKLVVNTAYKTH